MLVWKYVFFHKISFETYRKKNSCYMFQINLIIMEIILILIFNRFYLIKNILKSYFSFKSIFIKYNLLKINFI